MVLLRRWLASLRSPRLLDQAILVGLALFATSLVLAWQSAYLHDASQLLAAAVGNLLALAGAGLSLLLNRRGRRRAASGALLASLLLWLGTAGGMVVAALAWAAPFARYDPGPFRLPSLSLLSLNAVFLGVLFWQIMAMSLRPTGTIRARLLLTSALLILFTGVAITYFNQIVIVRIQKHDASRHLREVAAHTELAAEGWVDALQSSLTLYARHVRPQLSILLADEQQDQAASSAALLHVLEDLHETSLQSRLFDDLAILDPSGTAIYATQQRPGPWTPIGAECLPPALVGPCFQAPRYDAALGAAVIVVAEPIIGSDGRALGVVAGYARLSRLGAQVEARGLGERLSITLLDRDQQVLATVPAERAGGVAPDLGLFQAAGQEPAGARFYEDGRGIAVVGTYHWLPRLQAGLLVEQDQSAVFRPEILTLDLHLGVTLLLLALGVVIATAVVRSIIAPLRVLSAAAEQIASGALDVTAEVQQDDEIGALARAFNQMTDRLRQARDQLEQRVQRRTEELGRANAELQAENTVRRQAEQAVQFERNKLKSILNAMDDGVYIVNRQYQIEYTNPALEREFGPVGGRPCYGYLYERCEPCPFCPNELVWQGQSVRREESLGNGKVYDTFDTPLVSADGSLTKLAIFHDVTARRQAEDGIRQRNQELAVLSRRLVEIQEGERRYIARELHDETGQLLTSLMLRLGILERDLPRDTAAAGDLAAIKRMVEEVLESLHGLAAGLRPPSLDLVGLAPALRQYLERISERHGLTVDFVTAGLDGQRLPAECEITVYRIIQEALANVVRHGQATQVDVIVELRPGGLRVVVEDNGRGFDVQQGMFTGRLGLIGMRERAETIGGRLTVDSSPGEGTLILMEAPCDDAHPDR